MTRRTDSQLIEIVTKFRDDYEDDAVLAAEFEIAKRDFSMEELEHAKNEVIKKEEYQSTPLSTGEKLKFYLLGWVPGTWVEIALLKADGKITKSEEARGAARMGCFGGIIIAVLAIVILNSVSG